MTSQTLLSNLGTTATANLANTILDTTEQQGQRVPTLPVAAIHDRWVVAVKASLLVVLFNIIAVFLVALGTVHFVHKNQLAPMLSGKKPSNTLVLIVALTTVVSVVVGYTAYKVFLLDVRYGLDISNNLKVYYRDLNNILLNLIPLVLVYILLYKYTDRASGASQVTAPSA